jgi:putative Mg2+ transporter-C (MgtC) family protein
MYITYADVIARLLVITLLSGLIGIEREYHNKPAGLRTNVVVGLGATLITIASIHFVDAYPGYALYSASTIISTILTGIGFIGAGAILRPTTGKANVIGLTTAATLWVVTGLGIAVGMGFYFEAIVTTLFVFFTFLVLSKIVNRVREYTRLHPPAYDHDEDVIDHNHDAA